MPRIAFIVEGDRAEVESSRGETLLEAASRAAGLLVDAPCGGRGRCGKCQVEVEGELEAPSLEEAERLAKDAPPSLRLACLARVGEGDIVVRPPAGGGAAGGASVAIEGPGWDGHFDPPVGTETLEVEAPTLGDPRGDLERVLAALRTRGEEPSVEHAALRELPAALRAGIVPGGADVARLSRLELLRSASSILRFRPAAAGAPVPLAAAVDVGTTTIVVRLLDLGNGASLGAASELNEQRLAGADVVSRMKYCMERPDGLDLLSARVVGQIEGMSRALCENAGRDPSDLALVAVAGNSVMSHLLAGVDPSGIAAAPFAPAFRRALELSAREAGFALGAGRARLLLLPGVSGYVGSDIVAGLVAAGLDRRAGDWLYLDLGTNGELALGGSGRMLCCATAAGPAFEGAHIERGSASVRGAVSEVAFEAGAVRCSTIGGAPPIGICGSGILDAAALLLRGGAVDETGRLLDADEAGEAGWADGGAAARALLAGRFESAGGGAIALDAERLVYLTQKDLREIQLASAAIAAGVDVLLSRRGIGVQGLSGIVLAGGFGSFLDPESACDLGLLPAAAAGRAASIGNASAAGAARCALSKRDLERAELLAERMEYVELSSSPDFNDRYVERMIFPAARRPA